MKPLRQHLLESLTESVNKRVADGGTESLAEYVDSLFQLVLLLC